MNDLVISNNNQMTAFSNERAFEAAQRMAKALITSSMVPEQFRGDQNIGNAIIALEMSQRINASPLLVMQNIYLVHGKPGWSSKFLIATFNQCGRFSAIRYRTKGTQGTKDYGVQAYAIEKSTGAEVEGPWITWELVKAEGWDKPRGSMQSKWLTMSEKMFRYRAASWMIDLIAPEISMGLPTTDQLHDIIDVDPETGEVLSEMPKTMATSVKDKINSRIKEVSEAIEHPQETMPQAIDPNQLIKIIDGAEGTDTLDEVEDLARDMDKRSKAYKAVHHALETKRKEFLSMPGTSND